MVFILVRPTAGAFCMLALVGPRAGGPFLLWSGFVLGEPPLPSLCIPLSSLILPSLLFFLTMMCVCLSPICLRVASLVGARPVCGRGVGRGGELLGK